MPGFTDSPQVVTTAPDGSDPQWLGQAGHFNQLTYSYTLPGGPDQLSGVLQKPAASRVRAIDAGRAVGVYRGGVRVWDGKMDEAIPGNNGWQIAAHGAGTYGTDFAAYYTGTYTSDGPVNLAISRGLRWVNPGIGSGSTVFLPATPPDPASQTITDHLNTITTTAGSVWRVGRWNILSVYAPSWTVPTRILIATSPAARNLYGYPTVIYGRYQATADNPTSGAAATFGTTSITNTANAAKHGNMEVYADLSAHGVMSAGTAQGILTSILAKYVAASYGGSFTVRRGQLLTMGGTPVDIGSSQAGTVCQLVFAAGGYGGEIVPALPVTFLVGGYSYDDTAQQATITPYQAADFSLTTLLSDWVTLHPKPA
jgi:hypothetical protein